MIDIKELRIGNWVQGHKGDYWCLTIDMLSHIAKRRAEGCQPIPLTPEILEKAGFEICFPGAYKNQSNDRLMVLWPNLSWPKRPGLGYSIKENDKTIWIEFVHQLQNLFFALHQEELEINL